jgi:hypothetical protein
MNKKTTPPNMNEVLGVRTHNGAFRVIRIHADTKTVDLTPQNGKGPDLIGIPWGALIFDREDVNQAAARIVREATES